VTHPFGAVKEQVPTTYAKLLAGQGFVTLVLDASYQGESGGEPHFSEFPSARVEDIRPLPHSLARAAEVDLKVMQDMLGHSRIVLTAGTCTPVPPEVARSAAEDVATLVIAAGCLVPQHHPAPSAQVPRPRRQTVAVFREPRTPGTPGQPSRTDGPVRQQEPAERDRPGVAAQCAHDAALGSRTPGHTTANLCP
jgi:hypothetical protein